MGQDTVKWPLSGSSRPQKDPVLFLVVMVLTMAGSGLACGQGVGANDPSNQLWGPVFLISLMAGIWLYFWWCCLSLSRNLCGIRANAGLGLNIVAFGVALADTSDYTWPIYLAVGGVALIGLGCWTGALGASATRRQELIRETGWQTTATLTYIDPAKPSADDPITGCLATFTFQDLEGQQRWVQRPMLVSRDEEIPVGTTTRVWMAHDEPVDEDKIVVELSEEHFKNNSW